jgi:hypothetical protein
MPSLQCAPSAPGTAHPTRCHSTRSRSRPADTWPPVRTTARQNRRVGSGAAGALSAFALPAGRSPASWVGSMVVAAMVLGLVLSAVPGWCWVESVLQVADQLLVPQSASLPDIVILSLRDLTFDILELRGSREWDPSSCLLRMTWNPTAFLHRPVLGRAFGRQLLGRVRQHAHRAPNAKHGIDQS